MASADREVEKSVPRWTSGSGEASLTRDDSTFHVRALTKVYGTGAAEVRALRGVDLDVRRGETLVLLGPAGSGKSTLLNILGGLDRATEGRVVFHERDLTQASATELTRYRR